MNRCTFNERGCDQVDIRPVRLGFRRDLQLMCAGCRASASQVITVVERRVADVPVARDRRHWRPQWLARLTAREDGSWRHVA